MVRPPFSVRQSHAQIASVTVASLASTFFQSGDLSECGQPKSPACKRVKFDCGALMWNVMFKGMMVGGESARRFDKCENGGLDWR
jgi:hypothetical protein